MIQTFDTDKKQYVRQEFIAGGEVDYEHGGPGHPVGIPVERDTMAEFNFGPEAEAEPYLPFDMLQPVEIPYADGRLGK